MRLRSKQIRAFLIASVVSMLVAEDRLLGLWMRAGQAAWVQQNFISTDTNAMAAAANAAVMAATTELAAEAARFNTVELPEELNRK